MSTHLRLEIIANQSNVPKSDQKAHPTKGDAWRKLHPWNSLHNLQAALQVKEISSLWIGQSPFSAVYSSHKAGEGSWRILQVSTFPDL